MTYKEAIKCIEDVLNSDYHYDESLGYQLTSDDFEWLEKAKEAFEKQIPKKLKRYSLSCWHYGICSCGGHIDGWCGVRPPGFEAAKYCPDCGQAVDWGEE